MKRNISLWILCIELLAIVVLHANKDNSDRIKDVLLKRNQSGLIKATPITPSPMNKLVVKK